MEGAVASSTATVKNNENAPPPPPETNTVHHDDANVNDMEYMVGAFYDDMRDEDCIDLDSILDATAASSPSESSHRREGAAINHNDGTNKEERTTSTGSIINGIIVEDEKKRDVLRIINSLNINLDSLDKDRAGSRLKRRPQPPLEEADMDTASTTSKSGQRHAIDSDEDDNDENNNPQNNNDDSVLIVSAIDGTLAGISRSSGQILWKQSRNDHTSRSSSSSSSTTTSPEDDTNNNESSSYTTSSAVSLDSWNKFLSPLVSTTTKTTSSSTSIPGRSHHQSQWHAVPSIDGTVYLTAALEDNESSSSSSQHEHELSTTTHIRDLVDRAPFVDAHGRFFVGSRKAMVAAVDEQTGEILRVIPKWKGNDDNSNREDEGELPPSLEGRNVVWIGRLEHSVTVHELQKGTVDLEFSIAQILSVDEMIRGSGSGEKHEHVLSAVDVMDNGNMNMGKETTNHNFDGDNDDDDSEEEEGSMERILTKYIAEALRHPNDGDRLLSLPAPSDFDEDDLDAFEGITDYDKIDSSTRRGSPFLVTTPDGNVAFRNDAESSFGWVSFHLLDSPVVYAIEASSGQKIKVNIIGDALPSSSSDSKQTPHNGDNDLSELLQKKIAYLSRQLLAPPDAEIENDECNAGECRALAIREQIGSLVGALKDGQLYALPLGTQATRQHQYQLALPLPHSKASSVSQAQEIHRAGLNTHHAIGLHHHEGESTGMDLDSGDMQRIHIDTSKQACTPASPLYPGCLIGVSLMMGNMILDRDEMASVFEASDLDFDLYLDMLEENQNRKKTRFVSSLIKIMSSWIAPVVALIFVLSFEMGRRERLKRDRENADALDKGNDESNTLNNNISSGVIQLTDEILGYGGHGTIVYKGVLDKRQVAVKRLLSMYHTSADREISLLIESDGHPNVVRYFLKEIRGDFVYLALELCAM